MTPLKKFTAEHAELAHLGKVVVIGSHPEQRHTGLSARRLDASREEGICDFTPKWHAASGRLLGTGHTVVYQDDKLMPVRPRDTAW